MKAVLQQTALLTLAVYVATILTIVISVYTSGPEGSDFAVGLTLVSILFFWVVPFAAALVVLAVGGLRSLISGRSF